MGCDIHMLAEIKMEYPNKEVLPEWEVVGRVFPDPYYNPKRTPYFVGEEYENNEKFTYEPYNNRNYDLFAILANVRNGSGFAGVDTGDGFKPIDLPRGVPKDASSFYKKLVKKWSGDGHSHSYFTLQELLDFDWKGQTTTKRGWIDYKEYQVFKKKGRPSGWSGDIWGNRIKKISNKKMDKIPKDTKREYFTQVSWRVSYKEAAKDFVDETIPRLQKLLKKEDVLEVRIVFFFDN